MVQVEMNEEAAKIIDGLKNSGYDVAVLDIANDIIKNLQTEVGGLITNSEDGNLLMAAKFLLDYRDLIKALED